MNSGQQGGLSDNEAHRLLEQMERDKMRLHARFGFRAHVTTAVHDAAFRMASRCGNAVMPLKQLYVWALNEMRTILRRERAQERAVQRRQDSSLGDAEQSSAASEVIENELWEALRVAEGQLPDQESCIWTLHKQGIEYKEIARLTGTTEAAIKMRVKRIRARIERCLPRSYRREGA